MILSKLPSLARLSTPNITIKLDMKQLSRQVLGEADVLQSNNRKQPSKLEIMVLSDQMMKEFRSLDKYMVCHAMRGYDWNNFRMDIEDDLIDVSTPHVIIFLGTMQLSIFEAQRVHNEIRKLLEAFYHKKTNINILISGLVPRPMDYQQSCKKCESVNMSLRLISHDLAVKLLCDIDFVEVFS